MIAERIGYPVLVRPSYVLGGREMRICYDESMLRARPVQPSSLVDRFVEDAIEVDVDAICDGHRTWIGAVMQHVEEAGVHSGDSACVIPTLSLGDEIEQQIREQTRAIAQALGVRGLINVQFAVQGAQIYVIEANPRASRTVPFVAKATGRNLVEAACRAALELPVDLTEEAPEHISVKAAVLPFQRFFGADPALGPEMRSTGEVMGIGPDFPTAFAKAERAAGRPLPRQGRVFLSVRDADKPAATMLAALLQSLGFELVATDGTARALQRIGIPVETVQQGHPGLAQRGRPDPRVGHQPDHQHAARTRRPQRRLRDPRGRHPPPHPLHHHAGGRVGGGAGDRTGPQRRPDRAAGPAPPGGGGDDMPPDLGRRTLAVMRVETVGAYALLVLETTAAIPACPASSSCCRRCPSRPTATCHVRSRRPGPTSTRSRSCWTCAGPAPRRWQRAAEVSLLGPLGHGFELRDGPAILVGGGIGAAILPWLVRRLTGPVTTLLGFRDEAHAVCAALIDADATVVLEPTYVTEPLHRLLPADACVYACGPGRRCCRRWPRCAPSMARPASWRWRRRWPAGSAPATAARCASTASGSGSASRARCWTRGGSWCRRGGGR